LLSQHADGLFVVADEVGCNAAGVVGSEVANTRRVQRDELSENFDLRWTSRRENQVANLLSGAQHAGEQGVSVHAAGGGGELDIDRDWRCARCCHARSLGGAATRGERRY